MSPDRQRLERLLGGAGLAALRARLRERYARGSAVEQFTLSGLSVPERRALEGLLGLPPRHAGSLRLSAAALDQAVARAGLAADFRAALEALDGPIEDRKALRQARNLAWENTFATVSHVALQQLLTITTARGLVKRLARSDPETASNLLRQAASILERVPAAGMPLARLAAEATGDAHALDEGRALGTLVLAVFGPGPDPDADAEGARPRSRWAALGVSVNELAAPALILNLPAVPDTPGGRLALQACQLGEPLHLSLRTLLRAPPRWQVSGHRIFVCENPTVVAIAADALGAGCAPLLCTEGMPAASQRTLLSQLAACGAELHYRGDFDWPGIRIGNWVVRSVGARPWRFSAEDYQAHASRSRRQLQGAPVAAIWDGRLEAAMSQEGRALEEESVVADLLADLAV